MSLVVEGLTYVYAAGTPWAATALDGVDLRVERGEAVAILGATGSGKSTLVQHFNGLLRPTSGRVLVDGTDLWAPGTDLRAVRRKVGLVFQYPEHQLFEETVFADVAFGPRNLGLDPGEVERRVREALAAVGLPPEIGDRSPFQLSGGQMRRVAIAGVLAMRPEILVLDEPTAGLDPAGREELLDRLRALRRRHRLTLVVVSHHMDEVARLCERGVVLERGRVVADEPLRRLFAQPGRLREWGLDVPAASRIVHGLRASGWDLPPDVLDLEEAERAILAWTGRAGRTARRVP